MTASSSLSIFENPLLRGKPASNLDNFVHIFSSSAP